MNGEGHSDCGQLDSGIVYGVAVMDHRCGRVEWFMGVWSIAGGKQKWVNRSHIKAKEAHIDHM